MSSREKAGLRKPIFNSERIVELRRRGDAPITDEKLTIFADIQSLVDRAACEAGIAPEDLIAQVIVNLLPATGADAERAIAPAPSRAPGRTGDSRAEHHPS